MNARSLHFLAPALVAGFLTGAGVAQAQDWSYAAYLGAMKESGRPTELSERDFKMLQDRRAKALPRIENYLKERFGAADPR